MKIPNQTKPIERKANGPYHRAAGGVNPSLNGVMGNLTSLLTVLDAFRQ